MNSKTKIYFIENSYDYNGNDLNSEKIGGSEKVLINISNALSVNKEYIIKVFNNTSGPKLIDKVYWCNIDQIEKSDIPDYLIAMGDANLLFYFDCKNNYLWSHSIQSIEKFIRKKQLIPFLKKKPKMILEGHYHYKNRNFLTSFFGKHILKIAPDNDFIKANVDINYLPPSNAIFTTKSDRNIELLLNAWIEIKKKNRISKLYINPPYKLKTDHINNGIILRKKGDKKHLIEDLKSSRLFLTPGHKTEVFCLAADEARELCIPIVTMGIGCLYERVEHEKTGFIAKDINEFVKYSNLILQDNDIFLQFRKNLIKKRNLRNYNHVKDDLLKILLKK